MSPLLRRIAIRAVLADGRQLSLSELDWEASRYARAARFTFKLPVEASSAPGILQGLLARGRISIEVSATNELVAPAWQQVLVGCADQVRWDPVIGILMCEGRDLVSLLIEYRVPQGYLNRTSSEVAAAIADACGLKGDISPTARMVGQFYQIEHRRLPMLSHSGRSTGWDLLNELAEFEGYRLGVSGERLMFSPETRTSAPMAAWTFTGDAWATLLGPDVEQIDFAALPDIDESRSVRVRSWNSRQRDVVDTGAESDGGVYEVIRPNLAADVARQLATGLLQRVRPRAWSIQVALPGELELQPGDTTQISGTKTDWDRLYRIDEIERSVSVQGGFRQSFSGSAVLED